LLGGDIMKIAHVRVDWGQDCFNKDWGLEVVVSGCRRRCCTGCHSPHLWNFNVGEDWGEPLRSRILNLLQTRKHKAFIVLGGEPLDQAPADLFDLLSTVRPYVEYIILWTGYSKQHVENLCGKEEWQQVFNLLDYIKVGEYRKDLPKKGKLASSNQAVYKVERGRLTEEVEFI